MTSCYSFASVFPLRNDASEPHIAGAAQISDTVVQEAAHSPDDDDRHAPQCKEEDAYANRAIQ